jgi:GntR family transcriptional regulator
MARDGEAAYQAIAADFAERIESGELVDGDRLPTRPELEEQYGVSRQVIQNALNLLHYEGYLSSQSARGTFVSRPPVVSLPIYAFEREERHIDAFIAIVKDAGHVGSQQLRVEIVEPPAAIAASLGLSAGELVVVRRRVRFVNGIPYALADSYFPRRLVDGTPIASPADIPQGGRHILAELGLAMTSHEDEIRCRRPSRAEAGQLGIQPGCAVIAHNRLSSTADGKPIRLLATVLPSDRWEITYEDLGG